MPLIQYKCYEAIKDYLNPNIHNFTDHYKCGNFIDLPAFHVCNKVNKNRTRERILYEIG